MSESDQRASLIEYPCDFPIKVMGKAHPEFVLTIVRLVRQLDPGFDENRLEYRQSSGGNYIGLTVTVWATSRMQLDELYRTLSTHPMVSVVL